jgi:hypothetical protein
MTAQPSSPFDISPMLKMYMESLELWKKNYESIVANATDQQGVGEANGHADKPREIAPSVGGGASTHDAAMLDWQKSAGDLFKRFIQNQVELCHFFGNRWEQYLKLPGQLSQCRSLTEIGNLQTSFLSQFANDYMNETQKLAQPVAELMKSWPGAKAN